jgi:hypothetical protein
MRTCKLTVIILILALLMAGCAAQAGPDAPPAPAANDPTDTPAPQPTNGQPREATWSIDISDTQQITDEMGLLWNYTLTFHASKPGGTDPAGEYQGEAVLNIEPDIGSAQALAAREGTQLLAMVFNYHAECESLTFTIASFSQDGYAEQMKTYNPDDPLTQFNPDDATDYFAITSATFNATQESIPMTISDGKDVISGSVPGRSTTVSVPTEITTDGATAYCFFYDTPHPLARAFKGTVTGDVL